MTTELPVELWRSIIDCLAWRIGDLAAISRVAHSFHKFAQPVLYHRLYLRDQTRLRSVFATLAQCPHLAAHVRILEIRVWPFGDRAEDLEALEVQLVSAVSAMCNLRELAWTRTGSLNDRVLRTIFTNLKSLRRLEIGGDSRAWSTDLLIRQLEPLDIRHISIIMPDRKVANALPSLVERLKLSLSGLNVLCQYGSTVIDDDLLTRIAVEAHLETLSLMGSKKVTAKGLLPLFQAAREGGLRSLSLEGLSIHPQDLSKFLPLVPALGVLSLTHPRAAVCRSAEFFAALADFVEGLPHLEELTLYASSSTKVDVEGGAGGDSGSEDEYEQGYHINDGEQADAEHLPSDPSQAISSFSNLSIKSSAQSLAPPPTRPNNAPYLSTHFLRRLLATSGGKLRKLSISRILTSLEQLSLICDSCLSLSELNIQLWYADAVRKESHSDFEGSLHSADTPHPAVQHTLGRLLYRLPHLRALHILSESSDLLFDLSDIKTVAEGCQGELRQIGFRNRVWNVERIPPSGSESPSSPAKKVSDGIESESTARVIRPSHLKCDVQLVGWDLNTFISSGKMPEALLVMGV